MKLGDMIQNFIEQHRKCIIEIFRGFAKNDRDFDFDISDDMYMTTPYLKRSFCKFQIPIYKAEDRKWYTRVKDALEKKGYRINSSGYNIYIRVDWNL